MSDDLTVNEGAEIPAEENLTEEVSEQVKEVVEETAPETEAETEPEAPQMHKVKIDGEEVEVPLSELLKGYSTSKASYKKFEAASKLKKEMDSVVASFKDNPVEALSQMGVDARELAYSLINEEIEDQMLTDEQREANQREALFKKQQEELESLKKEKEEAQIRSLTDKYVQSYEEQILNILDTGKIPKTSTSVKKVAQYLYDNIENNYELSNDMISDLVREDYESDFKSILSEADPAALISFLGDDQIKKIREYEVSKVQSQSKAAPTPEEPKPKKDDRMTWEEFEKDLEKYS